MKKIEFLIATALVIIMLASCSSIDDSVLSDMSTTEITETLDGTSWKVVYYFDNSDGESTDDFAGYTFDFAEDGTLTATLGSETFTGTWVIKNSDDDPDYDKEIDINIAGNKQMDEVEGSWLITELSDTSMKLKDDNGAEEIHFSKL
ncbi:MAG: hypothetical protein ACKVPJ_00425 [Chitinophagales bacterium]